MIVDKMENGVWTRTETESKEVLSLMENQETTDKYVSTSLNINGNNARIEVDIDEDGNVTVL